PSNGLVRNQLRRNGFKLEGTPIDLHCPAGAVAIGLHTAQSGDPVWQLLQSRPGAEYFLHRAANLDAALEPQYASVVTRSAPTRNHISCRTDSRSRQCSPCKAVPEPGSRHS